MAADLHACVTSKAADRLVVDVEGHLVAIGTVFLNSKAVVGELRDDEAATPLACWDLGGAEVHLSNRHPAGLLENQPGWPAMRPKQAWRSSAGAEIDVLIRPRGQIGSLRSL